MSGMFRGASSFNQSLKLWNVSKVTNMSVMFGGAPSFNQPLGSWNVSNVTNMFKTFSDASSFNQPLESWNVSNVTDMFKMFYGASSPTCSTVHHRSISRWSHGTSATSLTCPGHSHGQHVPWCIIVQSAVGVMERQQRH
eukprot:TRINITY_DN350_c0_g1_i3.p2 TRINITY_DN350_c0_g1~~TRINITY_DN350_c0_g1_i3.p2  ORF type:complete len:148 (-),score=18.62 TRINITY_DN350_c0_g1_i3:404-820(-)